MKLAFIGFNWVRVLTFVFLPVRAVLVSTVGILRGPGPHQPGLPGLALALCRDDVPVARVRGLEVAVHAGDHGGVVGDGLRGGRGWHPEYLLAPVLTRMKTIIVGHVTNKLLNF